MSLEFESEMEEPQACSGIDPKVAEGLVHSQQTIKPRLMEIIKGIFTGKIGVRDAQFQLDELMIEQKENLNMMNKIANTQKSQEQKE